MKLRRFCLLLFAMACLLLLGILASEINFEENYMSSSFQKKTGSTADHSTHRRNPRIITPFDNVESWKIPTVVPFNDEQRVYFTEIVCAVMRVMAKETPLEIEEERIIGPGRFRWPKNPAEPIKTVKSYFGENFRMLGVSGSFSRHSENDPWSKVGLSVHPRNFPVGVYSMKFPKEIFKNFRLLKVVQEARPTERIKKPIVFYFEHRAIESLSLKIEARDDVASVQDLYPSSFHALIMIRERL